MRINDNFRLIPKNYLFTEVAQRIAAFRETHPQTDIIRMDIGDVTLPLPQKSIDAMYQAVDDFSKATTFHGYGPEQGHKFLREAISEVDYKSRGIDISADEIFISDGAKSDLGNLGDILSRECKVALTDPCYPVYRDANIIDGRAGMPIDGIFPGLEFLECKAEEGFKPTLPKSTPPDVIYLCFPNNPTGVTLTAEELGIWVDYARHHKSLIIYDSAYEAYIRTPGIPRSIYEIEGAKEIAIEVRSFSKTAGFTGLRLGYTVVPETLTSRYDDGTIASLHDMWRRRQTTKFNGASYIVQRGATALYTPEGRNQLQANIDIYMDNARLLREGLTACGLQVSGGIDSPYVWARAQGADSWELFDQLLKEAHVSSTPGIGFGKCGVGCLRFTGFNTPENTQRAISQISSTLHSLKNTTYTCQI
ncbi:MAG: LL-diaminopimelate aminotransferase [Muribaculaceae bacterium]|nr:LL-diaminopimelate aminotransferase [Muribaculaceae bacterium]